MVRSSVSPVVSACKDDSLRVWIPVDSTSPPQGYPKIGENGGTSHPETGIWFLNPQQQYLGGVLSERLPRNFPRLHWNI